MGRANYYPSLDGLRGVAALCVVLLHRGDWYRLDGWLAHGYLAVDFFFMLSGFVIAGAYEARLAGGGGRGLADFCRIRAIRLYPLIVLGVALGALWRWVAVHFDAPAPPPAEVAVLAIKGMLTLPTLARNGAGSGVFPLDGPTWSLFFEIAANLAWALLVPWLTTRRLLALLGVSAAALAVLAMRQGGVEVGATPATFWWGFARVSFPFLAGVMLFRLKDRPALAWPATPLAVPAVLLLAALNIPSLGPKGAALADLACVLAGFPLLLALAIRCRPGPAATRACRALGELSYPVYVLHYPLFVIVGGVAWHQGWLREATEPLVGAVSLAVILAAATAALLLYDRPVRRRLTALGRPPAPAPVAVPAAPVPARETVDA